MVSTEAAHPVPPIVPRPRAQGNVTITHNPTFCRSYMLEQLVIGFSLGIGVAIHHDCILLRKLGLRKG